MKLLTPFVCYIDEQIRIYYKESLELLMKEEIANMCLKDDWNTKFETIQKANACDVISTLPRG